MDGLNHIVKQLSFDIAISGIGDYLPLVDEISDYFQTSFLEELDSQFAIYKSGNYQIIDQLEIDLGNVTNKQWQEQINSNLENTIKTKIGTVLVDSYSSSTTVSKIDSKLNSGNLLNENIESSPNTSFQIENSTELKSFYFFLREGYLPWWYDYDKTSSQHFDSLYNQNLSPQIKKEMMTLLNNNINALVRFVQTVPSENVGIMLGIKNLIERANTLESLIFDFFTKTVAPDLKRKKLQNIIKFILIKHHEKLLKDSSSIYSQILLLLVSHEGIENELNINGEILKSTKTAKDILLNLTVDIKIAPIEMETFISKIQKICKKNQEKQMLKEEKGLYKTKASSDSDLSCKYLISNSLKDQNNKKDLVEKNGTIISTLDKNLSLNEPDGVYVYHSGIIIVHPMLPTFFKSLGFLEEGQWKDHKSQHRAFQLLYYIATGDFKIKEHEALLLKHLCGLEHNELIEINFKPNAQEIKETNKLLESIIAHWSVLKNTSIQGLREGFFDRLGKLYKDEVGWNLQIEQKSQDILIQHLPWGLGIVKFPWLEALLRINWT